MLTGLGPSTAKLGKEKTLVKTFSGTDIREKTQVELFGGQPCDGEPTLETECNTDECPGIEIFKTLIK